MLASRSRDEPANVNSRGFAGAISGRLKEDTGPFLNYLPRPFDHGKSNGQPKAEIPATLGVEKNTFGANW